MMENSHRKASKDKKHPRVPIKTYRWEDVRRSRKRGGYPWTYLYKQPLGDDMDSPWNKTEINDRRELSEWEELMLEEAEDISEIRELSATPTYVKTSNSSLGVSGSLLDERGHSPGIFFLDSAESSDDISQYLDKEDQAAAGKMEMEAEQTPPENAETRKRKVSESSDQSKMSLGKSMMMKKLKDAKAKMKVPKLSIPTSRLRKTITKKSSSPPKTQPASQVKKEAKEVKPVYIHIPLKPPPGETDSNSETKGEPIKVQSKKLRSFKDAVKGIKHLHRDQKEIGTISEEATENNIETNSDEEAKQGKRTKSDQPESKDNIVETPLETNEDHRREQEADDVDNALKNMEATENEFNINSDYNSHQGQVESDQLRHTEKDVEDADKDEEQDSKQYNDMFDDLFKASSSVIRKDVEPRDRTLRSKSAEPERKRKMSLESAYSRKSLSKLGLLKKLKNASDKIKKAFSRPNLRQEQEKDEITEARQEKPKEKKKGSRAEPVAPVYIHIPLRDEHAEVETSEVKDMDTDELDSQISAPGKVELIILTAPSDDEVLDYNSSDVPETPSSDNKLFFGNKITELQELAKGVIDEVSPEEKRKLCTVNEEASENGASAKSDSSLDPSVQSESTPSGTVELINSPGVVPQSDSSKPQESDTQTHIVELKQPASDTCKENTLVDDEDGLSEPNAADVSKSPDIEEEANTLDNLRVEHTRNVEEKVQQLELDSLATPTGESTIPDNKLESSKGELSPKLKKKVSFRKKAKLMGDGSYEDVEVPRGSFEDKDAVCTAVAENGNKALDVEPVRLPVEEDDNKWSKISDHEYEPVNPPPEEFVMIPCTTMSQTSNILNIATDHPDRDLPLPEFPEHPDPNEPTETLTPEMHAEHPDTERKSNLHKIQSEFKRKALDLKGKFHAMKRPHISLPARPVFHKPNFKIDKAKMSLQRVKDKFPSLKQTANRRHSTESDDGDAKKTIFSTYPRIFKKKSARYDEATAPDFATVPRNRTKKLSSDEPIRIPLHSENSIDKPEETYVRGESPPPSRLRYSEDIENDDECDEEDDFEYKGDTMARWDRGASSPELPNNVVTDLDLPEEQPNIQGEYKDHYSSGSSNGLHRQGVLEEIDSDEFFLRQKGISQDNIEVGMYLSSEIRDAFRTPMNALSQMNHPEYDPEGSTQSIPEVSAKRKPMKKPKRKKTPHVSQERIEPYEESGDEEGGLPPRPKRNSRRCRKQKPAQEDLVPYQETISVDEPHDRMFEHRESLAVLGDDERDEEANAYENRGVVGKQQPDISITDYVEGPVVPPRKQKSLKSLNFSENDSILGRAYSDDVIPKLEAIRTESKIIIPITTEVPERPSRSRSRSQIIAPSCREFQDENENAFNKVTDRHIPYVDEPEPESAKTTDYYRHCSEQPEINCRETVEDFIVRENEPSFKKVTKFPVVEGAAEREPCVEEICKQDIRDCMGYAIIDKSKARDPPLPPPRIPKRRKKPLNTGNNRFATIQGTPLKEKSPIRPLRNYSTLSQIRKTCPYTDNYENEENIDITQYIEIDDATKKLQSGDVIQKMKDRPLPAPPRPPRKTRPLHDIASEENIMVMLTDKDAGEAEVSTQTEPLPDDFVCEEVVQEPTDTIIIPTERRKKQIKPLPDNFECDEGIEKLLEDVVISTEGHEVPIESLVDNFVCGEITEEPSEAINVPKERHKRQTDTVIIPTDSRKKQIEPLLDDFKSEDPSENVVIPTEGHKEPTKSLVDNFECEEISKEPSEALKVPSSQYTKLLPDDFAKEDCMEAERSEREINLITPTVFTHEETITHGSLLVEPLDGAEILPPQKERRIPVHVESNDEETSSIPEEFNKLMSSPTKEPTTGKESGGENIPRKQEHQLRNLDIDTLTVNRLLAEKIVVSELDAGTIKTNDISSESGSLQVAGFNLPPELMKEMIVAIKSEQSKGDESVTAKSDGHTAEEVDADGSNVGDLDKTKIVHTPIDMEVCMTEDKDSANSSSHPIESRGGQSIVEAIVTEEKLVSETVEFEENSHSSMLSETADETFPLAEANTPSRPPRQSERKKNSPRREEPEVDDEPPPRPPQPQIAYVPSQPPASFYNLKAERYLENFSDSVPLAPRRRRHAKAKHRSRSSSDESSAATVPRRRSRRRSSSPTLGELSSTLLRVCGGEINGALKRLVAYVLSNVRRSEDGKQDVNVVMIIVVVLIAGLILLGYGEDRTVVHLHHWDYFNPPTNM